MGRLRKGQSLLLSLLEKGEQIFPPVPPTKKPDGRRSKGGDADTVNMPTQLLKRRANSQSKSLPQTKKPDGRSEGGDADTVNMPTRLLKRRANSQSKPLPQTKKPGGRSEGKGVMLETVNMKSTNEEDVEQPPPLLRCRANIQSEPLPQTKKPGGRSEGGDAETINMQSESEEEMELPPPLQRHRANSHSEPLPQIKKPGGRSEGGDAKMKNMQSENEEEVELPPPLLRLRRIPNTALKKNQLPEIIQQGYASAAESVKKALVSELMSWDNFDVESMVDLANDAFASLASLHADFDGLYNSVRDLILYHWQLSEAKKELGMKGCLQKMEAHHSDLCDQSDKAHKALLGAQISVAKTEKLVTPLVTRIVEIRELLNDLAEKLKEGYEKIDAWQEECERLEKSYKDAKAKEQNSAKQVEELKMILKLVTPLVTRIVEIRELNDLEEKLKEGNEKIDAWQEECERLEKSYKDAKAKEQNSAKQVEELKMILEPFSSRHDKAMADIERTKVLLSSMCDLNNDHS